MKLFDKKLLIVGASGFGREVMTCAIDILAKDEHKFNEHIVFMETKEFCKRTTSVHGVPVITHNDFDPELYQVLVAIGDPLKRKMIVDSLPTGTQFTTLTHPSAIVSKWVSIGEGSIITAGTIITTDIEIGAHAHLNLHTTIGHDCTIGDYCTTAPGANISGLCTIGDRVYFGSSSVVKQKIEICNDVTIGMGAVVLKNIVEPGVYIGNPAKKLERI